MTIQSILYACTLALIALVIAPSAAPVFAAPGAHGPGGEHLDAAPRAGGTTAQPRLETKTELFELVATLEKSELSIFIDRFDTNEPVLNAKVEVESGALRARATFHADIGDYAVDDPPFLKAMAAPGTHPLIFTVTAGKESDLLEGSLVVAPATPTGAKDGEHHHFSGGWWLLAVGLALSGLLLLILRRRRAQPAFASGGRT